MRQQTEYTLWYAILCPTHRQTARAGFLEGISTDNVLEPITTELKDSDTEE